LELAVSALMETKNYQTALSLCEAKTRENPKDPAAYDLAGRVYAVQKDVKRAEDSFGKAISLQPSWPVPYTNLVRLYVAQGRTAEAIGRFEKAAKADPANVAPRLALAQIYGQSGEYAKAIPFYEKVLNEKPNLWVAVNDLAYLLSEYGTSKKDLDRALKLAMQARKQRGDDPAVLDNLGWLTFKKGDTDSALAFAKNAYAKNPTSPVINYHLGMIYHKLGNKAEAREHLRKALESKEDFPGKEEARKIQL
jgi:tetratricopeptide (TPR) repeat protein